MRKMMKKLDIELENCYGIKSLKHQFDYSNGKAYAIYAPNGSMKSSLAQTFKDVSNGAASKDRIFPNRVCTRNIFDENGSDLTKDNIFVIRPYDEECSHTEKTSTLLVDSKLRKEYEQLHIEINKSKETFIKALKAQSGSKKDIEKEISLAFTKSDDAFFKALNRIENELADEKNAPFSKIIYDKIFDDKVLSFLGTKDFKVAIQDYIKKYNELLDASTYFKRGTFNYYNASTIAKNLADNGFFDAKHTVNLNAVEKLEITTKEELEELINKEKEGITSDKELKTKLAALEKQIKKNQNLRDFEDYLSEHEEILPQLINLEAFKEEIWKSYIKVHLDLYKELIKKYRDTLKRNEEIEIEAGKQRTQWEKVIDIFNERFFVPFKLTAKNKIPVILGQEPMLSLGFTFEDGKEQVPVDKNDLMMVLSTGEKRAFYVLNIIFEVEARKKAQQETIFVIDDIADSFDYKNKYAIIQYLQDISEEPYFYQLILTHNFDFFRTINSRFIKYSCCLMASKSENGITLVKASGIKNIFTNDWKIHFFDDDKKKIASIPFIRNIIEYTKGDTDPDYIKLTSLLHVKSDTMGITQSELDDVYKRSFNGANGNSNNGHRPVVDIIHQEAVACLAACDGMNLENKVILSIAIRLAAEEFMINRIKDPSLTTGITNNQTAKLLNKFKESFSSESDVIEILNRVLLMTPENIHLNSFMYEPILDMSEEHLKKLYKEVLVLLGKPVP